MARSLGLQAYRALSRRTPALGYKPQTPRPKGEILWIHAPENNTLHCIIDLAHRFVSLRHGAHVIITGQQEQACSCEHVTIVATPSEHPDDVAAFLDHWTPDAGLWLFGELRPNLILEANRRALYLLLANAGQDGFDSPRDRWLPDVARSVLEAFDNIFARSDMAKARLNKLVRNASTLERTAPLLPGGQILPYAQSDLDDLTHCLSGRPLWCACAVQPSELSTILAAHRHALRLSHRLLLVLNPATEYQSQECLDKLQAEGLRTARWDDGEMPDDNTQVLLATAQDELGLWYRAAPLSFLGSSLASGQGGLDPFPAAALGTAILYGPNVRKHLPGYTRLAAAGAARIVNDANALGAAVAQLISPDHAASMAMSGWDVVTEGASVADRILDILQGALDARQEGAT